MAKPIPTIDETKALNKPSRKVSEGDIITGDTPEAARANTVNRKLRAKLNGEAAVLKDKFKQPGDKRAIVENYLANFPAEEKKLLLKILKQEFKLNPTKLTRDVELADGWQDGGYPYKYLMSRTNYDAIK